MLETKAANISPVFGFVSITLILEAALGQTGFPPESTKSVTEYAWFTPGLFSLNLTRGTRLFSIPTHLLSYLSILIQLVRVPVPGTGELEESNISKEKTKTPFVQLIDA